jgi:hypothetical protein
MNQKALKAILLGGLIAGTIDVFAPVVISNFKFGPSAVLKFIAGGLIGLPAARAGGMEIAGLGLLLQWAMSLIIAAIFVFAALRLRWMTRRWILAGFTYGIVVYFVMTYVVQPLSMVGKGWPPQVDLYGFCANLAAMLLFGLIIAWFAQRNLGRA